MKLADMKEGMELVVVTDSLECIDKGERRTVQRAPEGHLFVPCSMGTHLLMEETTLIDGEFPEFEVAAARDEVRANG